MSVRRVAAVMVLVLIVAAGAVTGLYYTGRIWARDGQKESPVGIYSLGEFVTNLSGDEGRRYIRVRLDVELSGSRAERELNSNRSLIRNEVLAALRASHYAELADEVGMELLAQRLREAIDAALELAGVQRVLFVEFVIQ